MKTEPLLPIFLNIQDLSRLIKTTDGLSKAETSQISRFLNRGLPPILQPSHLSVALGVSNRLIMNIAHNQQRFYRTFSIKKRTGSDREIHAPRVFLKVIQWWILDEILARADYHPAAHGFIPGRSIVSNARLHLKRSHILNVDIRDFFPSIKYPAVYSAFAHMGYSKAVSKTLTSLCTLDGMLPQGAPTSPALSNLVFKSKDGELAQLAKTRGMRYTRYADDMTFSAKKKIRRDFPRAVEKVIEKVGFTLNPEKIRFFGPGQRRIVTGMVVERRPQPIRRYRRKIRAIFHQASQNPAQFSERFDELNGLLGYVNAYDKDKGKEYRDIIKEVKKVRNQRGRDRN